MENNPHVWNHQADQTWYHDISGDTSASRPEDVPPARIRIPDPDLRPFSERLWQNVAAWNPYSYGPKYQL